MEEPQLMRLPLELLFHTMTVILPPNPTTIIPPNDEGTQLLLRFSLVCRATHAFAVHKLRQHCVYLDSHTRLSRFLLSLEASRSFLSSTASTGRPPLPSVYHHISSLYLAPFGRSMDNLPIARWTRELFYHTCGTLKRLMVDMPFDSLPFWSDHLNVGPVLLEGFEQLRNLEELVCTRDAVQLVAAAEETGDDDATNSTSNSSNSSGSSSRDPKSVLYKWPKLRRLGLNRPTCSRRFWECMADMPNLERVVLTSALAIGQGDFDFKSAYLDRTRRHISVVFADIRPYKRMKAFKTWQESDVQDPNVMHVMTYNMRIPPRKNYFDSNSEWLMGTALAGQLWDIKGPAIPAAPTLAVDNIWRLEEVHEDT